MPTSEPAPQVIELATRRRRGGTSAVPLIARERELGELRDAMDEALGGSGRVVLIGGEPGIGKTRLASVLAGEAESRGLPVCWGRGWEDGSAPAFWPWNVALRRWVSEVGDDELAAAVGPWAAELAHVFPVLRDRMPDLPPSERWESDGARFRLFDLVSGFLRAISRPAGLVVVLDDVHWADRSSLRLLEFVAADLADSRVLVVGTYRDTEVERESAFFGTVSRLAREVSMRRLALGGLSPANCARWIALAGMRGDAAALGQALHRETNGNPFFIGEVVHLLGEEPGGAALVPHGVREVIAQRLDRLGDDCRRTLAVAALSGDTIDARLLSEVLDGLPTADYLVRSVRDRILVEAEGRYAFAHALIRRVLVDEMAPSMRAAWHERIAAVLERQATVVTTELVRHLAAAGTPEALRKAFDYACRGAEEAANGLGWEEAARLWQIALDVGKRSGLLDAARRNALRLALARALRGAGDVPAARRLCDEVMAVCRRPADPETFARAALIYAGAMPEWGKVEPPVRAVLEEACRHGSELEDALRARLYARLAGDLVAANEVDQGPRVFALAEEAANAARRANAPGPLAIALLASYLAWGMRMRPSSDVPVAVPDPQEMLEAAVAGGEREIEPAIRYARCMSMLGCGEPEAFSAEVDGLATAAATSRVPEALWLADSLEALRATVQGRFDDAFEAMDRAIATARRAQLPNAAGVHATQRIMCFAFQGRLGEAVGEIDAFVETQFAGPGWRPFRAIARLASGDEVAARAEFEEMMAAGMGGADRGVMSRAYLMGLATLCVSLGDAERAPIIYERVARRREVWSVDGCVTLGPWTLAAGALARLCGRVEEAVRYYEEAIAFGRRMQSRPIVARGQSMLASLRSSLGVAGEERTVIGEMLEEAGQCADDIGLADVAARVARLQAKLRKRVEPEAAFRNEGDVWVVRYAGREVRVRDGKGPRYLATLLATPGREVHVLELGAESGERPSPGAEDGLAVGLGGSLDHSPDERARGEYRERLAELRAELDEAELFADAGRAERLRAELVQLVAQLAGRFGARPAVQGPAEAARKAVTKVLRTQIGRLLEVHPALGRHLRDSVQMGTVCVYAPATALEWGVAFGAA